MANIIHDRTKNIDKTAKRLAKDFKRTNIKSVRTGEAQPSPHQGSGVIWGNPSQMGGIKITPSVGGERIGIGPRDIGNLSGPRVGSYWADHQNLKIKK